MPDTKRNLSEMGAADIRLLLRDAKGRAAVIGDELQRRTCAHTCEACHVSGPRDNNEYEHICTNCGAIV